LSAIYLGCLLVSLIGCTLADIRFKLAIAVDTRRTVISVLCGTVFFLIWDMVGVQAGIFFRGQTDFLLGFTLAPEVPVEEFFFLLLLCYSTLLSFLGLGRIVHRARDRRAGN
jgi:lycopene cyclase domain-containing protein